MTTKTAKARPKTKRAPKPKNAVLSSAFLVGLTTVQVLFTLICGMDLAFAAVNGQILPHIVKALFAN